MAFTVLGIAARNAFTSNGRKSRTAITPTFSPCAASRSTVSMIVSMLLPIAMTTRSASACPW